MSLRYDFSAKLWRAPGGAAWHFVTLPVDLSGQIRAMTGSMLNAFGSLRVTAQIGAATWKTSLFVDSKANAFVLPVKAEIRRKAGIVAGDDVEVAVEIDL